MILKLLLLATIYVAPTGKDTNPGTKDKPLATLTAARDRARETSGPVEIILAKGTYQLKEPLVLTTEDNNTVFKGQQVIVSGGATLPAFEKVNEHLWKTKVPAGATIQQVFVNGKRAIRARTEWFKTKSASETPDGVKQIKLTIEQLNALVAIPDTELSNVIISIHHAWDRTRKYIQSRSIKDTTISITGRPMHAWNKLDNSSQFIFENAKEFLDEEGEWWLDPQGVLFYIPRKGETITKSTATIPIVDQFILINGDSSRNVENIRFEGISFQYSRYNMPADGNEPAQAAAPTMAVIMIDYAKNIQFTNCEVTHISTNAIWFRANCSDSKVEKCYFHDLGIGAVKIGEIRVPGNEEVVTKNITINNNIFRSGGHEFPTGVGVTIFQSSDNTVSHNEIADFGYSGVSVGWIWGYKYSPAKRNKIIYNHIHHLGWGLLSDMGGVYTLGPSEGTVVRNNNIHDIYSYGYGGWGLYTDEGSTGVVMENNLVYNCKSSGFHQHYGKENFIRNNIFVSQIKAQLEATRVEEHRSFSFTNNIIYWDRGVLIDKPGWEKVNFFADNNCYWDTRTTDIRFGQKDFKAWQAATGKDKNSIIEDPGFVNPSRFDFHVTNKSVIQKISFKPFAYEEAGVYGAPSWKRLALFDAGLVAKFAQLQTHSDNDH